jgi:neutral/alkaline ceramidase-like enzyme
MSRPCTRRFVLWLVRSILLGLIVTCSWSSVGQAAEKVFKAGAFAADITPLTFPISVNGGMRDRQATVAHDRLHARAMVLDDGDTQVAICVCDSCAIPRDLMDEAKRMATASTGIRTDHILISATHTHEAPSSTSVFQSDADAGYQQFLAQQIAKAIHEAHAQREPAEIGWAVGRDPTQVFNRRWKMKPGTVPPDPFDRTTDTVKMNPGYQNPGLLEQAGTVDPEVSVLSVRSKSGRPIALLANYSLHYVGGVEPLSADYFGEFARQIGSLMGTENARPAFVGIMSNGTSGDVNNVDYAHPAPPRQASFEQIVVVARSVADAAYRAAQTIEYRDRAPLAAREKELELGVRRPTADEVAKAQEILAAAKTPVLQALREVYARETVKLADYPPTVKMKLQALRIGDLGIVSSPCETFVETGLAIKRQSPLRPTFVIELANGYNGYLPTPEQHKLGGYETWRARSSYLETEAAPKITAALLELLNDVAGK